ncbi:hypothetical protein [Gemmatimonas sp.]|uniref:hypothetical protein n=1 Tax=Gemmatimonas sp. TaxID=1962908 RepID=UPI003F6F420F
MYTSFSRRCILSAIAAGALLSGARVLSAQSLEERLTIHASLNAGYGKSNDLPVLGIPKEGTVDYRVMTLQFRYQMAPNDAFVVQLLNRRLGSSPLAGVLNDVTTQMAYWQHRAGAITTKVGRTPLPRGLTNEVRYIGTVLPFFRQPFEISGDAFDAVDGVLVTGRRDLAKGFAVEGHAHFGASENRSVRATSTELTVRSSRAHNMIGAQGYLDAPGGVRLGVFANKYERRTPTQTGFRNFVAYSGQIDRSFGVLRAEHFRESGESPGADLKSRYVQAVAKLHPRIHLAGEHIRQTQRVFFTDTRLNTDIPSVRETGAAVNLFGAAGTVFKFEHRWRNGYTYDAFVAPTTVEGNTVRINPSRATNYWIASVATSF